MANNERKKNKDASHANSRLYLLKDSNQSNKNENISKLTDFTQYKQRHKETALLLKKRQRNKETSLCMGVDIDYLEKLRIHSGIFLSKLAHELGIPSAELRDYIAFNKVCPASFAQNWEYTLWNCIG